MNSTNNHRQVHILECIKDRVRSASGPQFIKWEHCMYTHKVRGATKYTRLQVYNILSLTSSVKWPLKAEVVYQNTQFYLVAGLGLATDSMVAIGVGPPRDIGTSLRSTAHPLPVVLQRSEHWSKVAGPSISSARFSPRRGVEMSYLASLFLTISSGIWPGCSCCGDIISAGGPRGNLSPVWVNNVHQG